MFENAHSFFRERTSTFEEEMRLSLLRAILIAIGISYKDRSPAANSGFGAQLPTQFEMF